jgi:hypothetical protein
MLTAVRRLRQFIDGKYALLATDGGGIGADRTVKITGQARTLMQGLTFLVPNSEFDIWESASQPHAWTVDTGDSSVCAKDATTVFSGDAAAKYSFGSGGSAGTYRGLTTNEPTVGAFCIPLRPGLAYRLIIASRVSSLTSAPSYRLTLTYDAGATLVASKVFAYKAANAWQVDQWAVTVPVGAEPRARLAVEFSRGDTTGRDFWVDSIRMDEEVPAIADVVRALAALQQSVVINGDAELGTGYWRLGTESGNNFDADLVDFLEGTRSFKVVLPAANNTIFTEWQCDRSTDVKDPTAGNDVLIPVAAQDRIDCKFAHKGTAGLMLFTVLARLYDLNKAFLSDLTLANINPNNGAWLTENQKTAVVPAGARFVQFYLKFNNVLQGAQTIRIDALRIRITKNCRFCRVGLGATQSIANNTETTITWGEPSGLFSDDWAMHDTVSNTDLITISGDDTPIMGWFRVRAQIRFVAGATGIRQVKIYDSGGTLVAEAQVPACATGPTTLACEYTFQDPGVTVGATYRVKVLHTQGAALNVDVSPGSYFEIVQLN